MVARRARPCDEVGAKHAARVGFVVDDHGLAQVRRQPSATMRATMSAWNPGQGTIRAGPVGRLRAAESARASPSAARRSPHCASRCIRKESSATVRRASARSARAFLSRPQRTQPRPYPRRIASTRGFARAGAQHRHRRHHSRHEELERRRDPAARRGELEDAGDAAGFNTRRISPNRPSDQRRGQRKPMLTKSKLASAKAAFPPRTKDRQLDASSSMPALIEFTRAPSGSDDAQASRATVRCRSRGRARPCRSEARKGVRRYRGRCRGRAASRRSRSRLRYRRRGRRRIAGALRRTSIAAGVIGARGGARGAKLGTRNFTFNVAVRR